MTKAYTRSYLNVWNESVRKPDQTYSIILSDVDQFKHINDAFEHLTGDRILSEISALFMKNIRNNDYFFRFGGDEFLLIFEAFPGEKIDKKLKEILDHIKRIELPESSVNISYSISFLGTGEDLEEKIHLTDTKMYRQKNEKRYQT
ncbi:MAG TPA: GGDEF domain-containing protein [Thermotogota bacterium]|nr:GGDEF domain-containing protein [Thermotogota bacterium]HPR96883.1 GGDEF domain-containing protein [Thermotogota bacterium]